MPTDWAICLQSKRFQIQCQIYRNEIDGMRMGIRLINI